MGFLGVNFWSRDFVWVLLGALGNLLGFDVCPHSIIRTLKIRRTPLGLHGAPHGAQFSSIFVQWVSVSLWMVLSIQTQDQAGIV